MLPSTWALVDHEGDEKPPAWHSAGLAVHGDVVHSSVYLYSFTYTTITQQPMGISSLRKATYNCHSPLGLK